MSCPVACCGVFDYYGMSAKLKILIDQLLAVAGITIHGRLRYDTLARYLNLKDQGKGCGTPEMTGCFVYLQAAYGLGRKLKN